jgi:hypothetical protein
MNQPRILKIAPACHCRIIRDVRPGWVPARCAPCQHGAQLDLQQSGNISFSFLQIS